MEKLFITPEYTTAKEIKRVRTKLGLTQKEFALLINASTKQRTNYRTDCSIVKNAGRAAVLSK